MRRSPRCERSDRCQRLPRMRTRRLAVRDRYEATSGSGLLVLTAGLAFAAWAGVVMGMVALMLFLFTVSTYVAVGFLIGGFLLGQFIDMTTR